jgi:NAD(P)H-flavin reductase
MDHLLTGVNRLREDAVVLIQSFLQYVLNKAPENWTGGTGFVTSDMIKDYMPDGGAAVEKSKVLLCGKCTQNYFRLILLTEICS